MARIAVVDLGFHWPSNIGSIVHTYGTAALFARHRHRVKLFCVALPDRMPRGRVEGTLPFEVEVLPFTRDEYRPELTGARFRAAVDRFAPDAVWIGEGWSMKNWVSAALVDAYPSFLRFYAYEMLCAYATMFSRERGNRVCGTDVLRDAQACDACFEHAYPRREIDAICAAQTSLTAFEASNARYFTADYRETLAHVLRTAACCVPQNRFLARRLERVGARTAIIPPGIDTRRWQVFSPPGDRVTRFFMPGRVDEAYKGLDLLLAAVRELRAERDDFVVHVTKDTVGEIEPGIESIGLHPRERMPELYGQHDVVMALPSWLEPLPYVGIEAFASARPLIGTQSGGMVDLVGDSEAAILVEPSDAGGLASVMRSMIDKPAERLERGQAARRRAVTEFEWEALYAQQYQPLLEAHSGSNIAPDLMSI